jgi:uncharacterized RDD family membrane protein YckC
MTPAGKGIRGFEALIDVFVCLVIFYVEAVLTGNTTAEGVGFNVTGVAALVGFAICLAYFVVCEAVLGATIGKVLTKLRVVREVDGGPIGWGAAVVRNLFRIVDGFAFYLVGFITICVTSKHQRLGDIVAGTIVVRRVATAVSQ